MEFFVDVPASQRNPVRVQAADWVLRLDAAPADGDLRKEFEQWLEQSEAHRDEYLKVRHTWSRLGKVPRDNVVQLAHPKRKPHRVRWIAAGAALAAACLALVLFPVIQRHVLADHVTGVAELRQVVLPDGSTVWIDAGSAIAVDYRPDNRAVTLLDGRAFFEVVKDGGRPFAVRADEASVVVTGTAFDVRKAAGTISVTVQSGSVAVTVEDLQEGNRLTGGQGLVYDRQARTVSLKEVAPAQVASWRSRRLIVYDTTFGDVVEELGRHMTGAIVVRDGGLNRRMVSGVFDLSHPHEALEGLAGSQRATVTRITPWLSIVSAP